MAQILFFVTEGATERQVGKALYDSDILSKVVQPKPTDWKSRYGKQREGYEQVIDALRKDRDLLHHSEHLLLLFDQEDSPSPAARADKIANDLRQGDSAGDRDQLSWRQVEGWDNLFECRLENSHVVLHISDVAAPGISNRDFDGYILQLLQGPHKDRIASALALPGTDARELLHKAEQEITQLMRHNGFPWKRNKSWLYAYITAFQYRKSHVWFAHGVVEIAAKSAPDEVRRVFAPLIAAWNLPAQGDGSQ